MADIKRLHYFDQQFLVEQDFNDEQRYHVDMRRLHNKAMHTPGVAEGLSVTKTANKAVTVAAGTAIDREGRELVLAAPQQVDLSDAAKFPPNGKVCVTINYKDDLSDPLPSDPTKFTRTLEKPVVKADSVEPPINGSDILLASFFMGADGNVPAGALGASGQRAGKGTVIEGLTGNIDLVPGAGISIVTNQQANNITLGATGLTSVDGVSNPGGNVDLLPANSIQIAPDNVNKRIIIGDNHSTIVAGNPHGVTPAMIGALEASKYDLGRRVLATLKFTQADTAPNATTNRTVPTSFQPKFVLIIGTITGFLSGRFYGGPISGFYDDTTAIQQWVGYIFTRISNQELISRSYDAGAVCVSIFQDSGVNPVPSETFQVSILDSTATGLNTRLIRSSGTAIPSFDITLRMLCMG
jgi:hypothetical protein